MKPQRLLLAAGIALTLSACGSLHNVNNVWCPPAPVPAPIPVPVPELAPPPPAPPVPVPVPPAPVVQTENINLAADALFSFDKSSSAGLLPIGRETLGKLANSLKEDYVRVDSIDLIGHTDRLGSAKYNQKLGLLRAETVRDYLRNAGVTANMNVASEGKNRPVSTNCAANNRNKSALKACLQVDRRVEVKAKVVGVPTVQK